MKHIWPAYDYLVFENHFTRIFCNSSVHFRILMSNNSSEGVKTIIQPGYLLCMLQLLHKSFFISITSYTVNYMLWCSSHIRWLNCTICFYHPPRKLSDAQIFQIVHVSWFCRVMYDRKVVVTQDGGYLAETNVYALTLRMVL